MANQIYKQLSQNKLLLMGVLNITPDSFFDGGKYTTIESARARAVELINAGADIIDVGGESSRPGSKPVDVHIELQRVVSAVRMIREVSDIPVSVDTTKAQVAQEAIKSGATIINDITALAGDENMADVARDYDVCVVLMHMLGSPQTMQANPSYKNWVVDEICEFFEERIAYACSRGIERSKLILDPGIGFGKTVEHNVDIIANCSMFNKFGLPVLLGPSNKRFLGSLLQSDSMDDRIWGTAAVASFAALNGIALLRVHDVAQMKHVLTVIDHLHKNKKNKLCSPR